MVCAQVMGNQVAVEMMVQSVILPLVLKSIQSFIIDIYSAALRLMSGISSHKIACFCLANYASHAAGCIDLNDANLVKCAVVVINEYAALLLTNCSGDVSGSDSGSSAPSTVLNLAFYDECKVVDFVVRFVAECKQGQEAAQCSRARFGDLSLMEYVAEGWRAQSADRKCVAGGADGHRAISSGTIGGC